MITKEFLIDNKLGLHARVASSFVQITNRFLSEVEINYNGNEFDGKSIMLIISMGISKGSKIIINITGVDEVEAMEKLEEFFNKDILEVQ